MSKIYITLLFTIAFCASSLQAQTTETVSDTLRLDDITITATKIPVSERETSRPVQIIERREIERSTGRDFAQLLNQQSGIRINNSQGTPSGNQTFFMQGASGDYTLILIDG